MDNNHMDDYVRVLEDRTDVKNEAEVGKLSVVSNIDEKGKLKTASAEEANQGNFLKFNSRSWTLEELHGELFQTVQRTQTLWLVQGAC